MEEIFLLTLFQFGIKKKEININRSQLMKNNQKVNYNRIKQNIKQILLLKQKSQDDKSIKGIGTA